MVALAGEFHLFGQLPLEIRASIWFLSLRPEVELADPHLSDQVIKLWIYYRIRQRAKQSASVCYDARQVALRRVRQSRNALNGIWCMEHLENQIRRSVSLYEFTAMCQHNMLQDLLTLELDENQKLGKTLPSRQKAQTRELLTREHGNPDPATEHPPEQGSETTTARTPDEADEEMADTTKEGTPTPLMEDKPPTAEED
ncbi:hypothetical protein PWT90_04254 [Aphanocladium album]|nr:hypothetical protein PWT90_04254 [Aphanocladium album]